MTQKLSTNKRRKPTTKKRKSNKKPESDSIANDPAIGAYVARARQYKAADQFSDAARMLKQAVDLAPENPQLRFELGKLHTDKRLYDYGAAELEMALSLDPELLPALIELGETYIKNNQFDKATPLLDEALAQQPDNPSLNVLYGSLKQNLGKIPEGLDYLRRGLELRLSQPTIDKTPPPKTSFGDDAVLQCVWDTLSQLARAGVHAFACYGTLLGLIRDGRLMPFDKDIDFGIPHSEMAAAGRCLEDNGWLPLPMSHIYNPLCYVHPVKIVSLDLSGFVVDSNDSHSYTGFWMPDVPWHWNRQTRYPPFELEKNKAPDGQPIWALSRPEDWLQAIYGDGWRVPDPTFDTVIAAKNLCDFSLMTQCYACSRIHKHWEGGNLPKALAVIDHTLAHRPDDELLHRVRRQVCGAPTELPTRPKQNDNLAKNGEKNNFERPDSAFDEAFEVSEDSLRFD